MTNYNVTDHSHQPALVVNHLKLETPYSRVFARIQTFTGTTHVFHTVYFHEHFSENGEPYYPVQNKRNIDLFSK
jgi:UDP-galactopyranose mutase